MTTQLTEQGSKTNYIALTAARKKTSQTKLIN